MSDKLRGSSPRRSGLARERTTGVGFTTKAEASSPAGKVGAAATFNAAPAAWMSPEWLRAEEVAEEYGDFA